MLNKRNILFLKGFVLITVFVGALFITAPGTVCAAGNPPDAFKQNARLGRGGNLGNILYRFDTWDKKMEQDELDLIKKAGFTNVRINIGPFSHCSDKPPYTIEPAFYERVDWTVNQALSRGFTVIIDNHEYHAMGDDPMGNRDKFLATWKQMADHYKDFPDNVYLGVLNEPYNNLTPYLWNYFLKDALKIIRASNPDRTLVLGPGAWNGIKAIEELELPEDDRNIIVEIHYYSPHHFTHQGASFAKGSEEWLGMTWRATPEEKQAVTDDFNKAVDWAQRHNRPLFLGEFGAYKKADMESRIAWTRFIRQTAEKDGMSWSIWELMETGFGVYDPEKKAWIQPLLDALVK
ncbi:glycoside hydrolase family 5 protein [bacterium]|nr:glycoside hydrolase family 5 protein [bacterium]